MNKDLHYNIIRTKRKSYSISVSSIGELILKLPQKTKQKEIDQIIERHRTWIDEKLQRRIKLNENNNVDKLVDFKEVMLLGERRKVILDGENETSITDSEVRINSTYQDRLGDFITMWFKNYARSYFTNRTKELSEQVKLNYKIVKLSSARKRWGSCSNKGNINLAWRLIMAPPFVIDSVVLHELAHTKHMDHTKKFYDLLDSIDNKRKASDKWLLENSYLLNLY